MIRQLALEIVCNPYDLHFIISEASRPSASSGWYIAVNRGADHSFKPLLSTDQPEQLRTSREDALYVIEMGVLYMALASVQIPEDSESMMRVSAAEGRTAKIVAVREAIEQSETFSGSCLTLPLIDQIMERLLVNDECISLDFRPRQLE